ncbi:KinB sensor domain-containing domain, partial [Pseudomonas aeruginosa]
QALERSQNDFRRVLEQGRANTVDSAEQAALDGVRNAYLQLQAQAIEGFAEAVVVGHGRFEQGRANTVDSAEQAALDGVRNAYLQLQAHTPALLEAPMADNDGFREAFNGLRL